MIRTSLSLAVGAAALVMSADAGACSYRYVNYAEEPYMAELVRSAHTIALARVTFVDALRQTERQFSPNVETHEYIFEVLEYLKNDSGRFFNYRASSPFPPILPADCEGFELEDYDPHASNADCLPDHIHQVLYARAMGVAKSGRDEWERFFYAAPFHHNGSGGISPPEQGGGDCSWAESYEINQVYLVFRDQSGAVIATNGLNMQSITRDDDAWLAAVQYFLAHPENNRLPARPVQFYFQGVDVYGVLEALECENQVRFEAVPFGDVDADIDEAWLTARFLGWHERVIENCEPGDRYFSAIDSEIYYFHGLPFLPIRDDMVDLSGIPSQYRIEPSEVPLADVISWLREEAETE
ncbi:MAG: hypothetical protein DHS20C06_16480 [Hyphobacterium sp.]|nr:MAG: hypothetical protein DHS20C06_16480 [Hyphobacterium sp.]